jgi:hypothetical protein
MAFSVLLLGLVMLGCASRQPVEGGPASDLDRKLSTFAWIEEGDLVTLIVGTRATFYREKTPYIPLEIAVANNGLKRLMLTRESFTLIDQDGNRYPMATPKELLENYDFLDLDQRPSGLMTSGRRANPMDELRDGVSMGLAELEGIVFNRFAAYTRYESKFSPSHQMQSGRSMVVIDSVRLPRYGYIIDFIYFPQPEGGLKGRRFELFMDSQDLPEPVFVKFMVK